jgi:hypothetical protein
MVHIQKIHEYLHQNRETKNPIEMQGRGKTRRRQPARSILGEAVLAVLSGDLRAASLSSVDSHAYR